MTDNGTPIGEVDQEWRRVMLPVYQANPYGGSRIFCNQRVDSAADGRSWRCTLPPGHGPRHVAHYESRCEVAYRWCDVDPDLAVSEGL